MEDFYCEVLQCLEVESRELLEAWQQKLRLKELHEENEIILK